MNQKIKYRILGISVIIGLIIIFLPFFQTRETLPTDTALVKAPPFPTSSPIQIASSNSSSQPIVAQQDKKIFITPSDTDDMKQLSENNPVSSQKTLGTSATAPPLTPPIAHSMSAEKSGSAQIAALFANDISDLKNEAWAVQIGSFKNKANALRLVDQLRADGYRAFIQQVSSAFGQNIRVLIGPESKRDAAYALASRLKSDLHIHGIVVSYKPLTL